MGQRMVITNRGVIGCAFIASVFLFSTPTIAAESCDKNSKTELTIPKPSDQVALDSFDYGSSLTLSPFISDSCANCQCLSFYGTLLPGTCGGSCKPANYTLILDPEGKAVRFFGTAKIHKYSKLSSDSHVSLSAEEQARLLELVNSSSQVKSVFSYLTEWRDLDQPYSIRVSKGVKSNEAQTSELLSGAGITTTSFIAHVSRARDEMFRLAGSQNPWPTYLGDLPTSDEIDSLEQMRTERKDYLPPPDGACPTPTKSKVEWISWAIDQARKVGKKGSDRETAQTLSNCWNEIKSVQANACMTNLRGYTERPFLEGQGMGMRVSNGDYYEKTKDFFAFPPELKEALPLRAFSVEMERDLDQKVKENRIDEVQPERLRGLARKMKEEGWKIMTYSSRLVPNGGKDYGRLIVYVPAKPGATDGRKYEQFIQLTVNQKTGKIDPSNGSAFPLVDAIAVDRTQSPPQSYFRQYMRVAGGEELRPNVSANGHGFTDRCTRCHSAGLRQIHPVSGTFMPDKLKEFTSVMESMQRVGWGGYFYSENQGPGLGIRLFDDPGAEIPESFPEGSEAAYLAQCMKSAMPGLSRPRRDEMLKASQCSTCHNGSIRATLTTAFMFDHIRQKVLLPPAGEGSIPPGSTLTQTERRTLLSCLKGQQSRTMPRWLVPDECRAEVARSQNCTDCGVSSPLQGN